MRYLITAMAAVALLAMAIFSIQNLEGVEVSFLLRSMTLSKCVVIIGTYLLGMVSGWGLVDLFKKSLAN